jgi:hypothetical protein
MRQARTLPHFDRVVLLGSSLYRQVARRAFEGVFLPAQISEPFGGMNLFSILRALKKAVRDVNIPVIHADHHLLPTVGVDKPTSQKDPENRHGFRNSGSGHSAAAD